MYLIPKMFGRRNHHPLPPWAEATETWDAVELHPEAVSRWKVCFPSNPLSSSRGRARAPKIPFFPTLPRFLNSLKHIKTKGRYLCWWLSFAGWGEPNTHLQPNKWRRGQIKDSPHASFISGPLLQPYEGSPSPFRNKLFLLLLAWDKKHTAANLLHKVSRQTAELLTPHGLFPRICGFAQRSQHFTCSPWWSLELCRNPVWSAHS